VSYLDLLAIVIIAISVFSAAFKGLPAELVSFSITVIGFFLASVLYESAAGILQSLELPENICLFFGFTLLFVSFMILGTLLGSFSERLPLINQMGSRSPLFAGSLGVIRGIFTNTVIFLAFTAFPVNSVLLAQSHIAPAFVLLANGLSTLTPEQLSRSFSDGYDRYRSGFGDAIIDNPGG
jgi:uncharacterized membrane protein required for colicin V production